MAGRMGAVGAKPSSASMLLPYRLDWPAWGGADAVSGMTFSRQFKNGDIAGGGGAGQADAADSDNGDWMEYGFEVAAGTYSLFVTYMVDPSFGIAEFLFDGVSAGTIDTYSGSSTFNSFGTLTGISLTDGHHVLRVQVNGKNASSSDYLLRIQWLALQRTGA